MPPIDPPRTLAQNIHAAICELDRVLTSNDRAYAALTGTTTPAGVAKARTAIAQHRIEIVVIQRNLRELDQELTPVRPPSRADMRAALQRAQNFGTGSTERKP